MNLIDLYPDFKVLYREVYELCRDTERMLSRKDETIDAQKVQLSQKDETIERLQKQIQELKNGK